MTPVRILLADDHAVLRSGLAVLLNAREEITVVGEAANGEDLLAQAVDLQPDLILLDLSMPRLGGLDVLPLLKQKVPKTQVLILTMHDDEGYLRQALKAGASGYVLKKAADVELITAIQAVMQGDVYVHPTMTKMLLNEIMPVQQPNNSKNAWNLLSDREQAVLQLVALGHTSKEIAERLSLSVKTIETYRARGMEKLNLPSRAALVRFALANGLLE